MLLASINLKCFLKLLEYLYFWSPFFRKLIYLKERKQRKHSKQQRFPLISKDKTPFLTLLFLLYHRHQPQLSKLIPCVSCHLGMPPIAGAARENR